MTTTLPARRGAIEKDPAQLSIPAPATCRRVPRGGRGPGQQPPVLPPWLRGERRHDLSRPDARPAVVVIRELAGQPAQEPAPPRPPRAPRWLMLWRHLRRWGRDVRAGVVELAGYLWFAYGFDVLAGHGRAAGRGLRRGVVRLVRAVVRLWWWIVLAVVMALGAR